MSSMAWFVLHDKKEVLCVQDGPISVAFFVGSIQVPELHFVSP